MEQSFDISFSDCMKRKQDTRSVEAITAPIGLPFVLKFTSLLMDTSYYRRIVFCVGMNQHRRGQRGLKTITIIL